MSHFYTKTKKYLKINNQITSNTCYIILKRADQYIYKYTLRTYTPKQIKRSLQCKGLL